MHPVEIRVLDPTRIDLMRGMLVMFGAAFEDASSYTARQPDDVYLEKLLGSENFIAIVAVHGGSVVGGLAAYELNKFEQARSEIYIYDLAVDATFRRKGIASRLILEVQQIAVQRGAFAVFVQADSGDEPAIALYSKLGSREDVLHFDIVVPDGGA